jgi:hypothetical protein
LLMLGWRYLQTPSGSADVRRASNGHDFWQPD